MLVIWLELLVQVDNGSGVVNLDTGWITIVGASSFNYNDSLTMEAFATVAGQWNNYELEMEVPDDWNQLGTW